MKICAIICEFNPFHNGHAYLIKRARELSGCDEVVCIMSGNFTQRGEICVLDQISRARHAVFGGADAVISLPSAFTVAPAEIFAEGAIHILGSIPQIDTLAFGCERGDRQQFLTAAQILFDESGKFAKVLGSFLDSGESYIKSYAEAFKSCGGDGEFITSPNNILGVEYTKAILKRDLNIKILPIKRVGAGYSDAQLKGDFSSAKAIRENIGSPLVNDNVPSEVFEDLRDFSAQTELFKQLAAFSLLDTTPADLVKIYGCREGLENKIFNLRGNSYDDIVRECTSKRYSSSRIRRILLANLLKLYQNDSQNYLQNALYIRPLAVKKQLADEVLGALSESDFPLILKYNDREKLNDIAKRCLESDERAARLYNFICSNNKNSFDYMEIV